jgi:citrate lyase alpha subunit
MQFHTEYLTFRTAKHREYVNITSQVESALRKSGIQDGMILVSAMHITAGVWVNDAEDACWPISTSGWRNWRLSGRTTGIMRPAKPMAIRT